MGSFFGRRAQAFTAANQQYFWLYANESTLNNATVDGYRLAIGDDTGNDEIRLEYIVNGALSSTVITSSGAVTNAVTDVGFLVRVTRSSSGAWQIFTNGTLPTTTGTGAIATDIPNSTNVATSQGTATHNTLVPASNGYVGVAALHSTGAGAIVGAEFDQIYFTGTTAGGAPPTLTAAGSATVDSNFNITFTDDATWRAAVTTVKCGASTLTDSTDYTLASGTLTLKPGGGNSCLRTAGSPTITVSATAYSDAAVSQPIGPGAIASYLVSATSPQALGFAFNTTVTAKDQYNNTVTTDSSTVVTMTSASGNVQFDSNGDTTFGDNTKTLASGTFTISTKNSVTESTTITATDANSKTGTSGSITFADVSLATDFFRSLTSGSWATPATWESSHDNSTWITATLAPDNNANTISVRNTHTVTVDTAVSADQVTVDAGGQITIAVGNVFTLTNGTGTDLAVNGTVIDSGTFTVSGSTWAVNAGGTFVYNTTTGISGALGSATLDSGSTFIYRGSSSLTPTPSISGRTYGNLSFESTSGTYAAASATGGTALTVNGSLSIGTTGAGTVTYTTAGFTGAINVAGSVSVGAGSSLTLGASTTSVTGNVGIGTSGVLALAGSPLSVNGNWSNGGTFTHGGSTVTFGGGNAQTITTGGSGAGKTFSGFAINKSGGTATLGGPLATATLDVTAGTFDTSSASSFAVTASGNVTIGATGTFAANASTIGVGGNWSNSGTFSAGTSTVNFNGATGQTVIGNTSFYNFNKTVAAAQQMNFTASSTTTVTNSLTFMGAAGNLLTLRSTTPATTWKLIAPATQSVSYVDVQDSDATGTNAVTALHSVNSGNNTNWIFNYTVTFDGNTNTGGSTAPQTSNVAANLTSNGFTKTGYSFAGWNTIALGGGTAYADGASYPFTADVTLYAQWIDNIAPDTTIDSSPPDPSNNAGPTFTFSGTDAGSGVASFECKLDAGAFAACTSPHALSSLTAASHTFQVRAIDGAGNPDASPATYTWTVDLTAPTTTIDTFPSNPTNSTSATFTFSSINFAAVAGYTYQCKLDAGSFASCSSSGINYPGLSAGSHTFMVKATDVAGNVEVTPVSYTWTIDLTPPAITYTPLPNTTSNASVPLSANVTDNLAVGSVSIFYAVNGGSFSSSACTAGVLPAYDCTIPGQATGSAVAYYVSASDTAGSTAANPSLGASLPNLYTVGAAAVPAGSYNDVDLAAGSSLGGNIVVADKLTLSGLVTTGIFSIELGCGGQVVGSPGGAGYNYVVGNFTKDFCGTGTFIFPSGTTPDGARDAGLGTGTLATATDTEQPEGGPPPEYTPLTMTINSGTFPAAITVNVVDNTLTGLDASKSVTRSWNVTQTGGPIDADMTFKYLDQDANGVEANYKVYKNASSATSEVTPNSVNTAANTATVTGVTSFSNWGAGVLIPTAAGVSISGRVLTADGRGIQNAMVTISGNNLSQHAVITGPFGYYTLTDLEAGQTYVLTVN